LLKGIKYYIILDSKMILDVLAGRRRLGIPVEWSKVDSWLNDRRKIPSDCNQEKSFIPTKYDLPKLDNYRGKADDSFWNRFPSKKAIEGPKTVVNFENLRKLLADNAEKLNCQQKRRAKKLYMDLKYGAKAYQKVALPALKCDNSSSAYEHGYLLTDKIASWIEDGFVCGPFENPPWPNFRSNPILAIERNNKIRPVINLSYPDGGSFNDNVIKNHLEKVKMSTAKEFSFAVLAAGPEATMSKFDIKDAYKLIPARKEDWPAQGFTWLGRHFFETQMVFGGVPSVSNFDRLGKTIVDLTLAKSNIPAKFVFRTLDDIPVVAPENTGITRKFSESLFEICEYLKVPLAKECPNNEKAFQNQTRGIVLGIGFDCKKSEWFLPEKKSEKVASACLKVVKTSFMTLKQVQEVMGLVNDLAQMCPFIKPFRYCGNTFMAEFAKREDILLEVPYRMKMDMYVCANVATEARFGLPIACRKGKPGLKAMEFYSDAAGACFTFVKGEKVVSYVPNDRGVASVAVDQTGKVWWWAEAKWPRKFLSEDLDEKGSQFGCKTTTLEAVGLLLPLLSIPEQLLGKEVIFYTDNLAVMYGWENGGVKFDKTATSLLRSVHVITAYLGMTVHVKHVRRMSNKYAVLVDHLSRESTIGQEDRELLKEAKFSSCENILKEWMKNPNDSFCLPRKLLAAVVKKVPLK
jgi:hypothetical protein